MSSRHPECSYCSTPAIQLFVSYDYNRRTDHTPFHHYRCPHCGLIFIDPIPDDLAPYYTADYHYIPDTTEFLNAVAPHEQYKIEIIHQYHRGGRLLEIGPSLGSFAWAAKCHGFNTTTVEIDQRCCDFLNNVAGIKTIQSGDPASAISQCEPFDVIALWHVIEHLPDPWSTLEAINQKLNPGGIVVIAAPNPYAFQFKLLGRYWPHTDAPRHLSLIPAELITQFLGNNGLQIELQTTRDTGGLRWNAFGWEYFFRNLTSNVRLKKMLGKAGNTLAKLLSHIDGIEGRGTAYTLVMRKPINTP